MDEIDRRIVVATQGGLPLDPQPYHRVAEQIGLTADEVMTRLQRMVESGMIRRIGVIPNHYALGYRANGMTVWDVADERIDELGDRIGALPYVSHCYHRPRHLPLWRYNLFAMLHGHTRAEVEAGVGQIRALLGDACADSRVLYSTRILKKTGLRLGAGKD
jgi:DNA-binding Lrp family transcriptional regulator